MTTDEIAKMMVDEVRELVSKSSAETRADVLEEVKRLLTELPVLKGDPGEPGKDAPPVDPDMVGDLVAAAVAKAVSEIPRPKDGASVNPLEVANQVLALIPKPRDGQDGVATVDELMKLVAVEVEKRLAVEVARQVEIAIKAVPRMEYKGVWSPGKYVKGDCTTFGGSIWVCRVDGTTEKPGTGPVPGSGSDWQLAVRAGRDANRSVRT